MATTETEIHPRRQIRNMALTAAMTIPGVLLGLAYLFDLPRPEMAPALESVVFGLAVVGAAFMLSWAAEVAQLDVSAGLAIAVLALIAVLPEYAVGFVFAWQGGRSNCEAPSGGENPCEFTLANMTGANRLLIGVGWAMVILIAWWRLGRAQKQRGEASNAAGRSIVLPRSSAVEVSFLAVASFYSLTLPLKDTVTLFDTLILIGIFVLYTVRISKAPPEEPHLVGPAALMGTFTATRRRVSYALLFAYAAIVILLSAEHFAEGLVHTGEQIGISSFLLVQWLAPLASESPELLVAGLYAWRLNTTNGMTTLLSSKVNQWTLLVGTLPIVFGMASFSLHGLPIHGNQAMELLLTAAQSVFAVSILVNLSVNAGEGLALLGLFVAQFVLGAVFAGSGGHSTELVVVSIGYLVLAAWLFFRQRHLLLGVLRDGFLTPYDELSERDRAESRPVTTEPAAE